MASCTPPGLGHGLAYAAFHSAGASSVRVLVPSAAHTTAQIHVLTPPCWHIPTWKVFHVPKPKSFPHNLLCYCLSIIYSVCFKSMWGYQKSEGRHDKLQSPCPFPVYIKHQQFSWFSFPKTSSVPYITQPCLLSIPAPKSSSWLFSRTTSLFSEAHCQAQTFPSVHYLVSQELAASSFQPFRMESSPNTARFTTKPYP